MWGALPAGRAEPQAEGACSHALEVQPPAPPSPLLGLRPEPSHLPLPGAGSPGVAESGSRGPLPSAHSSHSAPLGLIVGKERVRAYDEGEAWLIMVTGA